MKTKTMLKVSAGGFALSLAFLGAAQLYANRRDAAEAKEAMAVARTFLQEKGTCAELARQKNGVFRIPVGALAPETVIAYPAPGCTEDSVPVAPDYFTLWLKGRRIGLHYTSDYIY